MEERAVECRELEQQQMVLHADAAASGWDHECQAAARTAVAAGRSSLRNHAPEPVSHTEGAVLGSCCQDEILAPRCRSDLPEAVFLPNVAIGSDLSLVPEAMSHPCVAVGRRDPE